MARLRRPEAFALVRDNAEHGLSPQPNADECPGLGEDAEIAKLAEGVPCKVVSP